MTNLNKEKLTVCIPENLAEELIGHEAEINIAEVCLHALSERLEMADTNRRKERIREYLEQGCFNGDSLTDYPNIQEAIITVLGTMPYWDYHQIDKLVPDEKEPKFMIIDETPGTCIYAPYNLTAPAILMPSIIEHQKEVVIVGAVARMLAIFFICRLSKGEETVLGIERYDVKDGKINRIGARSSDSQWLHNTIERWGFLKQHEAFIRWQKAQVAERARLK